MISPSHPWLGLAGVEKYFFNTLLENEFRMRGGEAGYAGGFIDHYLTSWIYPEGLTRTAQFVIGTLFLALNVAVYGRRWQRMRSRRR